jgi:hypothetical protein
MNLAALVYWLPKKPRKRDSRRGLQRKPLRSYLVSRALPTHRGERKFRYLDLIPERFRDPCGILRTKKDLHRWGAVSCFKETDLYTVKYGRYESTEIEQFFFGKVDKEGREAVEFFSRYESFDDFKGDANPGKLFNSLLNSMSIQKFRTPKGLREPPRVF